MRGTAAALLVSAVLGRTAGGTPAPEPAQLDLLRDAAREALSSSCGRCHDHAEKTAKPAALRIFDLRESDWSARMSEEQMQHMVGRFEGFQMPPPDRVTVERYLDAERARRRAVANRGTEGKP
jgi:hypothetical protein